MMGSRRRARAITLGLALALVGARVAFGCGSEEPSPPLLSNPGRDSSILDEPDAADAQDAPNLPPRPDFCDDLVLYASFDKGFAPEVSGAQPVASGATHTAADGRFSNALMLRADVSDPDAGAALYFVGAAGMPLAFPREGTVSLWYRGAALDDDTSTRVFFRALASAANTPAIGAGVGLVAFPQHVAIVNASPTSNEQLLDFSKSSIEPFVHRGAFNHFATAWRQGTDAGPTALFSVNGGLGTLVDAGPDAWTGYEDASVNEAGALLVPYRGYATRAWDTDASPVSVRLGGAGITSANGDIDDFGLFRRVLSFDEVATIYLAGYPLRLLCRVR